jgi:hypothetical protein
LQRQLSQSRRHQLSRSFLPRRTQTSEQQQQQQQQQEQQQLLLHLSHIQSLHHQLQKQRQRYL